MRILMRIDPDDRQEHDGDRDGLAMALFQTVRNIYNEDAGDKEAYLVQPEQSGCAEELALVDGKENPVEIATIADTWNSDLARDFEKALADAIGETGDTPGSAKWLNVKSQTVYALKKAVMALDGDFYAFAENALLVNEYGYFTTRLENDQLADIRANPGDYACITVYPK